MQMDIFRYLVVKIHNSCLTFHILIDIHTNTSFSLTSHHLIHMHTHEDLTIFSRL